MNDINRTLDAYTEAWNSAFETKSDARIRQFMSKSFKGRGEIRESKNLSIMGTTMTLSKSFESVDVSERNDGAEILVYGTETNVINGRAIHAKALLIWRNEEGEWKLLREYIELTR